MTAIGVFPEHFDKRAVFVGKTYDEAFAVFRRFWREREHVPCNDVGFDVVQIKITLCVAKRRTGMSEAVQLVLVPVAFYVPVIEKIVV